MRIDLLAVIRIHQQFDQVTQRFPFLAGQRPLFVEQRREHPVDHLSVVLRQLPDP